MGDKYPFANGDWVQGKSRDGELIHGYVENVDSNRGLVKVNVVECDNEKVIGKPIWVLNQWTKKLPNVTVNDENHLLMLIDLALQTKDEQWFMELCAKLASIKKLSEEYNKKLEIPISRDRTGDLNTKR